jgi:hypothetical protein
MELNTQALATAFNKYREVIEAAETPFAKLAVFVLPVIAPAVPAFMTGVHLFQLFVEIFTFKYVNGVSGGMAGLASVTLELLGYVGAIAFIKSVFDWIHTKEDEYLLPMVINGLAYGFYLVAMYFINVELGKHFGTPAIVNNIFALLSFITVPSGLLAANHLNEIQANERKEKKEERERKERERQEARADKLEIEKTKIKNQAKANMRKVSLKRESQSRSHSQSQRPSQPKRETPKPSLTPQPQMNSSQAQIYALMDAAYKKDRHVMGFAEVMAQGFEKSTASRYRTKWLQDNPDKKPMGF